MKYSLVILALLGQLSYTEALSLNQMNQVSTIKDKEEAKTEAKEEAKAEAKEEKKEDAKEEKKEEAKEEKKEDAKEEKKEEAKEEKKEDAKEEKKEDAKEEKKEDSKEDKKEDSKEDAKEDKKQDSKDEKKADSKDEKEDKKGDDKEEGKGDDKKDDEEKKGEKKKEVLSPDPGRSEDENGKPIHETSAYPKRFAPPPRAPLGMQAKQITNHPALPGYKPPKNKEAEAAMSDEMPKKFVDKKAAKSPEDPVEPLVTDGGVPDAPTRNKQDAERIEYKKSKKQKLPEDLQKEVDDEKKEEKDAAKEEKEDKKEGEAKPKEAALVMLNEPCEPALDVSEKQLYIELDYFSRSYDIKHYNNAVKIYNELKGDGLNPRMFVTSWELYDRGFSFPRVRRYDLVQQHMDLLQHFEDNLNQNFMNSQHLANFIKVGKSAQKALNEKYHDGEFSDPALYDPEADHPTTWSNVKI